MVAAARTRVTVPEYLAMERASAEKHTLWDGEVFAMAGALPDHNAIVMNIGAELRALARRGGCRVFSPDQKVFVPLRQGFVYPDVTVVCDPLAFFDDTRDVITNPTLLVEVLSESTEAFDRGEKAMGYRGIASLRDLLFVSQTARYVEHFARQPDGAWTLREYRGDASVVLSTLGGALRLAEVYLSVPLVDG